MHARTLRRRGIVAGRFRQVDDYFNLNIVCGIFQRVVIPLLPALAVCLTCGHIEGTTDLARAV